MRGQPLSQDPTRALRGSLPLAVAAVTVLAACGGSTTQTTVAGPTDVRCQATLSAQPTPVPPNGGSIQVSINSARDCTWTASSEVSWIQLSVTSGQGSGTVAGTVARNDDVVARSGAILVNEQRLTVSQDPRPCPYELRASSTQVSHRGGRGTMDLTTLAACAWTASSSAPWMRISPSTGSGSGTIEFEASANEGGAREAIITVADQRVVVQQAPRTCDYDLRTRNVRVPYQGGRTSVELSTLTGCIWSASTGASWIRLLTPSGSSSGTIELDVSANDGGAREATVTVADQRLLVQQDSRPCTLTIGPTALDVEARGGDGRFRVDTPDGCQWSASSGAPWVAVASGQHTGPGDVVYTAQTNPTVSARSTTITVTGPSQSVTHTVRQAAATRVCTYVVAPASQNFGALGGDGSFDVQAQSACLWSATSGASWVIVRTTSSNYGSGSSVVAYVVLPNLSTSPRSTRITVAGQTHTISQAGLVP